MKKIYLLLLVCFILSACSKDFLKRYEKRIIGTWNLVDVDRRGLGGSISHQIFQAGEFTFREDGTVTYILDGVLYNGGWDIDRESRTTGCNTNSNGDIQCDDETIHELFISVTEPVSQYNRTERFDNIDFTSSNRFKAYIYADFKTYVFHFRRV